MHSTLYTNEESGLGFSIFSFFQTKGRLQCKNCLYSVAHRTLLKRCMTVIMDHYGLHLILMD